MNSNFSHFIHCIWNGRVGYYVNQCVQGLLVNDYGAMDTYVTSNPRVNDMFIYSNRTFRNFNHHLKIKWFWILQLSIVNRQDMDSEQSTKLLLSEESTRFKEFYTSKWQPKSCNLLSRNS